MSLILSLKPIVPLVLLLSPTFAGGIAGCSDGTGEDPKASCIADRFEGQPRARFIVGQTFYLPQLADRAECRDLSWKLDAAPSGNANEVVAGADGVARFSPHLPGSYAFSLSGAGTKETLQAISAEGLPFHNLNYFPGQSVAAVNGELWAASVYAPTVSRLDPATLKELGHIDVGAWPVAIAWAKGQKLAVVAQRGSDTLGLVGVESGRLEDAIWVGDEPSNVVVTPDGATAYVTLATEGAVVAVDLAARKVRARVETGNDPRAMAISHDGKTLYVASFRSGHPSRVPYASDPEDEEKDITVIDTAKDAVSTRFINVGETLQGLLLSEDDTRLYVSMLHSDPSIPINDTTQAAFAHVVLALDARTGQSLASADLSRQKTSAGPAVSVHGMALAGGHLWVAAEGSDAAVAIDPTTLEEVQRIAAPGRPRAVTALSDVVFVHGAQGFSVTRVDQGGAAVTAGAAGVDPRPELLARGQRQFTAAGQTFGVNSTCNSCHADGLSDTLVWKVGPVDLFEVSRPQFWLEGTDRLGWPGYVSTVENFAFAGNNTVGVRPTTDQFEGMAAYLASLMPPPPANGKTTRDGRLTEAAQRGKEIFEGKGACTACHGGPIGTSKQLLDEGISGGLTDVPSLVGAYRHGVWLKHGEARDLRTAVTAVLAKLNNTSLSSSEIDDVVRYLEELTAREFFVLSTEPKAGAAAAASDEPIKLAFTYPVFDAPENLARVELLDSAGNKVPAAIKADGRHVIVTPSEKLAASSKYTLRVGAALESLGEVKLVEETRVAFQTAAARALKLEGKYLWNIQLPTPKGGGEFDPSNTIPIAIPFEATSTEAGARLVFDYGQDLKRALTAVIDGAKVLVPPLGVPSGPAFADTAGFTAELIDADADGVADSAAGVFTITAPGIKVADIKWAFARSK